MSIAGFAMVVGLLALAQVAGGAEAAQPPASVPSGQEILSRLRQGHPRLLASLEDFAALKRLAETDPTARKWAADLRQRADRMLSEPPSTYEIPDGLRLLSTSRRVVGRVYTLGLLYRLTDDRRYADRAWRELEAAAGFPDWNPRHFLDTAEMTHGFAIGYDWLYDVWTEQQRQTLRKAIVEKGLTPALKSYRGDASYGWWTKANHNWNQVCNGGIGVGALALGDVEPEVAGEILHSALASLPLAMREYGPDGAWSEGPGYWRYATEYNVLILAALQTALGTDYGLSEIPGFSKAGSFPLAITGPLGRTFNYADGSDGTIRSPQMLWLASRFHQPAYARYERRYAAPEALDLLWYAPEKAGADGPEAPLDTYFRGAEVVSLRSAWEDRNATFVGFKAGDNKANHSNLDLGTFVLDALGQRWAVDLGADNYNLPGYFGKERWTYYRMRTEGHNTLVINPEGAPNQSPSAAAAISRFRSTPNRAFAVANLSPAYAQRARSVHRGIALLNRSAVLVQDEVQTDKPSEVWWFLHTPAEVEVDGDGTTATLQQGGEQLQARLLGPSDARFTVMDAKPLPSSPNPEGQNPNAGIRKLAVHLTGVRDLRLVVLLTPLKAGGSAPAPPEVTPLSSW